MARLISFVEQDHILDYLLTIEDDEDRASMLPDAFTPPSDQDSAPPAGSHPGAADPLLGSPANGDAAAGGSQAGGQAGRVRSDVKLTKKQKAAATTAAAGLEKLMAAGALDALDGPDSGDQASADEVQLSTTPMRLLNALDARFTAIQQVRKTRHDNLLSPCASQSITPYAIRHDQCHSSSLQNIEQ